MNQDKNLNIKIDANLYQQLKAYADREDDGMVSRSARRAIKLFLAGK
jgi:hypothetical protein